MAGAHKKLHALASVNDHSPGTNDTVVATISAALVEQAFAVTATANSLAKRSAAGQLTVPLTPALTSDAASKSYVDAQVAGGKTWKELLMVAEQLLDGVAGGVKQALAISMPTNMADGDTFIVKDAGSTETFTFRAAAPGAGEVLIGASAADTLANLVAKIVAEGVKWTAVDTTGLDGYFAGAPATQAVVINKVTAGVGADRVLGTIAGGQSGVKVVAFSDGITDAVEYASNDGTESDLPSIDPGSKRFGLTRAFAALVTNETHKIAEDITDRTWDEDDNLWRSTGLGSITAGLGMVQSGQAFNIVAADNSLTINANDMAVNLNANGLEVTAGGVGISAGGVGLTQLEDQKPKITLAGTEPVIADSSGILTAEGDWAYAEGTDGSVWKLVAVNDGVISQFAVELSKLTS